MKKKIKVYVVTNTDSGYYYVTEDFNKSQDIIFSLKNSAWEIAYVLR